MITEMRELQLRGALGQVIRTATYEGREYLVVPVIALMEGVIHAINAPSAEFVSGARLAAAAHTWNGRPLVLGHPAENGVQISANSPTVLEKQSFGWIFESQSRNKKLGMEAWIDPKRLEALGQHQMLADIRSGKPIEVSVGAFVKTLARSGTHNGRQYFAEWQDIVGDHLAFLPKGTGACSIEMGCGACRAAEAAEVYDVTGDTLEVLGGPGSGNFGHSGRPGERGGSGDGGGSGKDKSLTPKENKDADSLDRRMKQDLARHDNANKKYGGDIMGPGPEDYSDDPRFEAWSKKYGSDDSDRGFKKRKLEAPMSLFDKIKAALEPVLAAAETGVLDCPTCEGMGQMDGKDCATCDGRGKVKQVKAAEIKAACRCEEGQMTKAERIAALLQNEHNPLKDQKALEAAGDSAIKTLEDFCAAAATLKAATTTTTTTGPSAPTPSAPAPAAPAAPAPSAPAPSAPAPSAPAPSAPAPKTLSAAEVEEEFLKTAPESIRTLVAEKKAADAATKEALVGHLKTAAAAAFTEDELNAKSIAELQKLATLMKIEPQPVDFSGVRLPAPRAASGTLDQYAPPNPYDTGIKALQSKTVN